MQGSTIVVRRIHTYTYFYWHTHDFGHAYVDMYAHISLLFLKVFKFASSDNFVLLQKLLLYIWPLIYLL